MRPGRIFFPKRWSRAKRKNARAWAMYWRRLQPLLEAHLEATYADMFSRRNPLLDWYEASTRESRI